MLKLFNTLTRKKEAFKPLKGKRVLMYACGPTVYWYAHIGNLRTYIFGDILRRVLEHSGYTTKHVMNITDVGHLTSDADTGKDKVEESARKEKKTARQIAQFYTKAFQRDLKQLNIQSPTLWAQATGHIKEQIALIQTLEKKGVTYTIADGVYFDTSKIKGYGKLAGAKKRKLKAGARVEMVRGKKHLTDFALWKFSPPGVKRQMEWKSPWGVGFPGWHTECVAMSIKHLGIPFDIHTGGIDHIPIHHTNEIAQAQAAFNKDLAKFWLHGEFLILKEGKMGKSEGNIVILHDLIKRGINPLSFRYLCLSTHYRSQLTFSWKSLEAAQSAMDHLYEQVADIRPASKTHRKGITSYQEKFLASLNDDLNTPRALAILWDLIKDKTVLNKEKYPLLMDFDTVFGLKLAQVKRVRIPAIVQQLAKERKKYRKQKSWQKADDIRKKIEKLGYKIEDTQEGLKLRIK